MKTQNYLQATLQPSAKEILEAIRAMFLQVCNCSFFQLLNSILKKLTLSLDALAFIFCSFGYEYNDGFGWKFGTNTEKIASFANNFTTFDE